MPCEVCRRTRPAFMRLLPAAALMAVAVAGLIAGDECTGCAHGTVGGCVDHVTGLCFPGGGGSGCSGPTQLDCSLPATPALQMASTCASLRGGANEHIILLMDMTPESRSSITYISTFAMQLLQLLPGNTHVSLAIVNDVIMPTMFAALPSLCAVCVLTLVARRYKAASTPRIQASGWTGNEDETVGTRRLVDALEMLQNNNSEQTSIGQAIHSLSQTTVDGISPGDVPRAIVAFTDGTTREASDTLRRHINQATAVGHTRIYPVAVFGSNPPLLHVLDILAEGTDAGVLVLSANTSNDATTFVTNVLCGIAPPTTSSALPVLTPSAPCSDLDGGCHQWEILYSACNSPVYSVYMLANCRETCHFCGANQEILTMEDRTTLSPIQIPTSPASFPSSSPTQYPPVQLTPPPTQLPASNPSQSLTLSPSLYPTGFPTLRPTQLPTLPPTAFPSRVSYRSPTQYPPVQLTPPPTQLPASNPSQSLTLSPSLYPTGFPTLRPTQLPTLPPTAFPSRVSYRSPTQYPTVQLTQPPTQFPTSNPSQSLTLSPSLYPTGFPTLLPTQLPTHFRTQNPTVLPSTDQTAMQTSMPLLSAPLHCHDISSASNCRLWQSQRYCSQASRFYNFMLQRCNATCLFCGNHSPTAVPTLLPNYPPSRVPTFAPTLTPTVIAPPTNPSTESPLYAVPPICFDVQSLDHCLMWRTRFSACSLGNAYLPYMRANCNSTCMMCGSESPTRSPTHVPSSFSTQSSTHPPLIPPPLEPSPVLVPPICFDIIPASTCRLWYTHYSACTRGSTHYAYMQANCNDTCGFCDLRSTHSVSVPTPAPTSRECADNIDYRDSRGHSCQRWQGFPCERASIIDYTENETLHLLMNCPHSCGLCASTSSTVTSALDTLMSTETPLTDLTSDSKADTGEDVSSEIMTITGVLAAIFILAFGVAIVLYARYQRREDLEGGKTFDENTGTDVHKESVVGTSGSTTRATALPDARQVVDPKRTMNKVYKATANTRLENAQSDRNRFHCDYDQMTRQHRLMDGRMGWPTTPAQNYTRHTANIPEIATKRSHQEVQNQKHFPHHTKQSSHIIQRGYEGSVKCAPHDHYQTMLRTINPVQHHSAPTNEPKQQLRKQHQLDLHASPSYRRTHLEENYLSVGLDEIHFDQNSSNHAFYCAPSHYNDVGRIKRLPSDLSQATSTDDGFPYESENGLPNDQLSKPRWPDATSARFTLYTNDILPFSATNTKRMRDNAQGKYSATAAQDEWLYHRAAPTDGRVARR